MKLIKEMRDTNFPEDMSAVRIREAARIVLIDNEGKVPLLYVSKYGYHKLPGGGIDDGEDKKSALEREVLEEVGAKIEVANEIGKIIEYRLGEHFEVDYDLQQISYCYYGKVVEKGEPEFTQKELDEGFQLKWYPVDAVIDVVKNDTPTNYEGKWIQGRALAILEKSFDAMSSI